MCYLVAVVALAAAVGMAAQTGPPVNLREYQEQASAGRGYPLVITAQFNLQRVLDNDLETDLRVASLALVVKLQAPIPETTKILASVLTDQATPTVAREQMLKLLLDNPPEDVVELVLAVLNSPGVSPNMEQTLLDWLEIYGSRQMLARVVKLWSSKPPDGPNELRYRQVVGRIGGKPWDEVLFEAMGWSQFYARGSAQVILASRLSPAEYRARITGIRPSHECIAALQTFIRGYDYIPATKAELLKMVTVYVDERGTMEATSALYRRWRAADGYAFDIRDYHLLGALARDSQASSVSRAELVAELAQTLASRRHVPHYFGGTGEPDFDAGFRRAERDLTMADLWNLRLLNELLSRPDIQAGLRVLAAKDLDDTSGAWGGLVFFERGRANAKQYPPAVLDVPDDLVYPPTDRLVTDSLDSLCRFITHFENVNNSQRVGPTPQELADARASDYYGMTITRLDEDRFTAYYFNPDGIIVSLGVYNFTPPAR